MRLGNLKINGISIGEIANGCADKWDNEEQCRRCEVCDYFEQCDILMKEERCTHEPSIFTWWLDVEVEV